MQLLCSPIGNRKRKENITYERTPQSVCYVYVKANICLVAKCHPSRSDSHWMKCEVMFKELQFYKEVNSTGYKFPQHCPTDFSQVLRKTARTLSAPRAQVMRPAAPVLNTASTWTTCCTLDVAGQSRGRAASVFLEETAWTAPPALATPSAPVTLHFLAFR